MTNPNRSDATAIIAICDHLFLSLAENGVKTLVLRSDNAGNYRNACVIHTLRSVASKYGLTLSAYIFSEPQSGKGVADNRISHAKAKIRDVIDSGGYGRDAEQILKTLCTEPLLKAYSFYLIKGEEVSRSGVNIAGITSFSSFQYERDGIRVRRYNSIGDGKLIPYVQLDDVSYPYEILGKGGYLSMSPEFWGETAEKKQKKQDDKVVQVESDDDDVNDKKVNFRCPEENCIAKYLTLGGLASHLASEKHQKRAHSDTIVEAGMIFYAAKLFSEGIETNEMAYLSMRVDSLSSGRLTARSLKLTEGWAVRVKKGACAIDPAVRRSVRKYFVERRKEGKRAEAKWVVKMLRNATDPIDGSYIYPLKACLKETQAQSLITRFLKVEASKDGLKALESEDDNEEMDEEEDGEDDVFQQLATANEEPVKKGRGKPKKSESSTGKKTPARKAKGSNARKDEIHRQRDTYSLQSGEDVEDEKKGCEEEGEAVPSTTTQEEATSKRRGRARKSAPDAATGTKATPRGRKNKVDSEETTAAAPTTRILRDRKRGSEVDKKTYCEISSDEEIDDYTSFMNAIHEKYDELFSDEE